LDSAKSGRLGDGAVRSKRRIGRDIRNHHWRPATHGLPAGTIVPRAHSAKVFEKIHAKAALRNDDEFAGLWVDQLKIAHVCAVHVERRRKKLPQRDLEHRRERHSCTPQQRGHADALSGSRLPIAHEADQRRPEIVGW
jgi:hypothetical protein